MSIQVKAYLAENAKDPLHLTSIPRREVGSNDVSIKIKYCGICHSDVSFYKNDWGVTSYPLVPGHEIVGIVDNVGAEVTKFKVGDKVGVGCLVDSCRNCKNCKSLEEQYCLKGFTGTYGLKGPNGETLYGGYSEKIIVDENFVLSIPDNLDLAAAAPLLCAGITTYSPLKDAKVGPDSKVGFIGIGGLGHIGVKLAKGLGATVYAFTTKQEKRDALLKLGADEVIVTSDPKNFENYKDQLDVIVDTVSGPHDIAIYFSTLAKKGTYAMVGIGSQEYNVPSLGLLLKGAYFHGSAVGGIAETQEMLNLCGEKNIACEIEMGHFDNLPELYDRIDRGDVRFRFVLDIENDFSKL